MQMESRPLCDYLGEVSPKLSGEIGIIRREALDIWDEQFLRPFTSHGKSHIYQVERNLWDLSRPLHEKAQPLTPEETFVLIAACYLHDIGMQIDDPCAREEHAQFAYDMILNSHARFGGIERRVILTINDNNARRAIAEVARAHWTTYALQLEPEDYIYENQRGRIRLLGLLLAMADLLDISPVRARYFRTIHRLYDPDPVSELHQTMHALVRGFRITPPDPNIPSDLQFQLDWNDNSDEVQDISEWVMHWFTSQWRQLQPMLYRDSGGTIGWKIPWTKVTLNPPRGPIPTLSKQALDVLGAEITEQKRINRDMFVNQFKGALKDCESAILLLVADSNSDANALTNWCEAEARNHEKCLVARVDVLPSAVLDLSSIVSQLIEQWGGHLPECDDTVALEQLRDFLLANREMHFASIFVTERYESSLLQPLIDVYFEHSREEPHSARVLILVANQAAELTPVLGVQIHHIELPPMPDDEILFHLGSRKGYSVEDSQRLLQKINSIGLENRPALLYNFIENESRHWENQFP